MRRLPSVVPSWLAFVLVGLGLAVGIAFAILWDIGTEKLREERRARAVAERRFGRQCSHVAVVIGEMGRQAKLTGRRKEEFQRAAIERAPTTMELLVGIALDCLPPTGNGEYHGSPDVSLGVAFADLDKPEELDAAAKQVALWADWFTPRLDAASKTRWAAEEWLRAE